jgi:putative membrane protein
LTRPVVHLMTRSSRYAAALVALSPSRSSAHAPPMLDPWSLLDILTATALSAGLVAYVAGLLLSRPVARHRRRRATFAFAGGYLALGIALLSPLDAWAGASVAAHMAQHLLLVMLAAPLLVLARPWRVVLRLVPVARRRAVAVALASSVRTAASMAPLAWGLHVIVLWAWHAPPLWSAAQADPRLHALEHASFFGTALLFWWIVLDAHASQRLGPLGRLMFLFAATMQSTALGALLVLAERPWYADCGALDDQHLAGVLMWMPAGVIYLTAALGILKRALDGRRPGPAP